MNPLFVDAESTGLPFKDAEWRKHYRRFPHILALAWKFNDTEHYYIINQGQRRIPPAATRINGITDEICQASPYFIQEVLTKFAKDAYNAEVIVGHNTFFDSSLIKANALREFGEDHHVTKMLIDGLDKYKRIDLMRKTATYNKGWCTLLKLHEKLFGEPFKAHNAQEDCRALERCYNKAIELGILK